MIKKLSPRRVILIAVAFLLLAGVCYVLWPHRFADLQPECDSVTLICISLGVLFGIVMDNIGLGMMLGVAVGLCTGPAISVLKKNKKAEEQTDDEKQ